MVKKQLGNLNSDADAVQTAAGRAHCRQTGLNRRALVTGGLAAYATIAPCLAQSTRAADDWNAFKSRFMSDDGRIVDSGNNGVSHSEGQGWALLFAAAAQDRVGFDLIWNWTARALNRPADALHAWRYVPKDQPPVGDFNNATDGDMFIAAALSHAGRLWDRADYLRAASAIGNDILRLMVRRVGRFMVLLPGSQGFENASAIVVNPSYYAFPMMTELASLVPSPRWDRLQRDGRTLIERGRFGQWSLPPDWLRIAKADAALSPAPGWPARFSYDAVRVPLWWSWQKIPPGPAMQSIQRFWSASPPGSVPAWVDLATNEAAPYPAGSGMVAIMRLLAPSPGEPAASSPPTYYDAALMMLSRLAEEQFLSR